MLEDLNPQLLATIQSEFDKVDDQAPPVPCRTSADLVDTLDGGVKTASATNDPLDDLFPRVDLDRILSGTNIVKDANSEQWKTRKEALEQLQALLDSGPNKRLKPSMSEHNAILPLVLFLILL